MKVLTTQNPAKNTKTHAFNLCATNAVGYDENTCTIIVLPAQGE